MNKLLILRHSNALGETNNKKYNIEILINRLSFIFEETIDMYDIIEDYIFFKILWGRNEFTK